MDKVREHLKGLVSEFDELCRSAGIEYFLSGETLLYAAGTGSFGPSPYGAVVSMTADNAKAFIREFEDKKPANRVIEYWGNSPVYPDYSIRYTDTQTTVFNVIDFADYREHGMYVEIRILRSAGKSSKGRKLDLSDPALLERGILIHSHYTNTLRTFPKNAYDAKACAAYRAAVIKRGKQGVRADLFKRLTEKQSKPKPSGKGLSGTYTYTLSARMTTQISENYFADCDSCVVDGLELPVPVHAKALLRQIYPKRFHVKDGSVTVTDEPAYAANSIIDVDIPYSEFFAGSGVGKRAYMKIRLNKRLYDLQNRSNRDNKKVTAEDWAIVLQTDYRFKMYEHFKPLKEEILQLHEAGDTEALKEILKPYRERMDELMPAKKPFSFDNDILNIYLELLEDEGRFDEVDRILKYMPASHLKDPDAGIGEVK